MVDASLQPLLEAFTQSLAPNPVRGAIGAGARACIDCRPTGSCPLGDDFADRLQSTPAAGAYQASRGLFKTGITTTRLQHHGPAGTLPASVANRSGCPFLLELGGPGWAILNSQPTLCADKCCRVLGIPLQLITLDSVAVEVRQAAAVNFKNTIKYHWVRGCCVVASLALACSGGWC